MHLRINACQNRVHLNIEAACQEVAMCSGADLAHGRSLPSRLLVDSLLSSP